MKTVAVIIPIYKAHDTIQSTLHSVFMQRHIDYKCYLIVDGEGVGTYDYLKEKFDVNIYYMPVNKGPGVARQYGIDHTKEPYLSFIDADDAYLTTLGLFYQHLPFEQYSKAVVVSSDFWQERINKSFVLQKKSMVWMHGKMYKREYLDKYDIRFNETRVNEDIGFNVQCQCYEKEDEQVIYIKEPTYLWQWRDDSIVRTDNRSFSFTQSINGFVENELYAIKRALAKTKEQDSKFNIKIQMIIVSGLVYLFNQYIDAKKQMPKQLKYIKTYTKIYYSELYSMVTNEYVEEQILDYLEIKDKKGFYGFKEQLTEPLNIKELDTRSKIKALV